MKLSNIKKTNLKKKHVEPPEESIIAQFSEVGPGSDADMEKHPLNPCISWNIHNLAQTVSATPKRDNQEFRIFKIQSG